MSSLSLATTFANALKLHERGQLAQAVELYEQIIETDPQYSDAIHSLGVAALQQGEAELAMQHFKAAIHIDPALHMAYANLGNALLMQGRFTEAVPQYDRALQLRPDFSGALFNRGNALLELQRTEEALASFERLLQMEPGSVAALNNHGQALLTLQRYEAALQSFDHALGLEPDYYLAWNNRANALLELHRASEALTSCDRALSLAPNFAEAHYNRGNALLDLQRPDEALASYDRALHLSPDYVAALINRATSLLALHRPTEALASCELALALNPDDAEALNALGNCLLALNHPEHALQCFDAALQLRSNYMDAINNRADTLQRLQRYSDAAESLATLLAIAPNYDYARGRLLHAQLHGCDWSGYTEHVNALLQDVAMGKRADLPFSMLAIAASPVLQLRCAQIYAEDKYPSTKPVWTGQRYRHKRVRIAYISADFRDHPVAYLLAGLLERHDHTKFEIMGVSLRNESSPSPIGQRIRSACEQYFDVSARSDRDVSLLLNNLQVDIAIDLTGHTSGSRPGILAFRPAPIQVNYLGFPATMGADYIDYLIADSVVVPESSEAAYAEHIVRLPHSYFPPSFSRLESVATPTRSAAGLPATGFVFCAFNNTYKISPQMFRTWMELLRTVPDSVLWMREFTATATDNLRREAASQGVSAERLIFAPRVGSMEQHLARQRLADLFLDTAPYNGHTTSSDALSAGVPVLTCMGETFVSRVAASQLQAIGLSELITHTLSDYVALAKHLATQPKTLSAIRNKLAAHQATQPLFDVDRYQRNLEQAYLTMYQRHQDGLPPISFSSIDHGLPKA